MILLAAISWPMGSARATSEYKSILPHREEYYFQCGVDSIPTTPLRYLLIIQLDWIKKVKMSLLASSGARVQGGKAT